MIKECRIRAGVTQVELAERVDVDRSTVAKWETGAAKPRADKLVGLAKALGCSVDELLRNEEKDSA